MPIFSGKIGEILAKKYNKILENLPFLSDSIDMYICKTKIKCDDLLIIITYSETLSKIKSLTEFCKNTNFL